MRSSMIEGKQSLKLVWGTDRLLTPLMHFFVNCRTGVNTSRHAFVDDTRGEGGGRETAPADPLRRT